MMKPHVAVAALIALTTMLAGGAQPTSAVPSGRQARTDSNTRLACTAGPSSVQLGPVAVLSPDGGWVSWPNVVVDDSGRATATFQVRTGAPRVAALWSVDLPATAGDPRLVRSDEAAFPRSSDMEQIRQIGIDDAGTQTLAWPEKDLSLGSNGGDRVMVATRPLGGDWSAPTSLNRKDYFLVNVHLAVNRDGAAVVTWAKGTGRLMVSYRAAGSSTWSKPESLVRRRAFSNEVGIDGAGKVVVVYDVGGVHVRRFRPGKGWGPATAIGNRLGFDSNLAVSANGTAVLAWEQPPLGGGRTGTFTARMTPAGHWRAPVRSRGSHAVNDGELAIDGRGRAIAAWRNRHHDIVVQSSRKDGSWRPETVLAKQQPAPRGWPVVRVAVNQRGDTLVVWKTVRGEDQRLRGSYRAVNGGWSPVRRLTPVGKRVKTYATAVGPHGEAVVSWLGQRRVQARRIIPPAVPGSAWQASPARQCPGLEARSSRT